MFAKSKVVKINGKDIVCKDFTYGHITGLENGTIEDTVANSVMNGTDMTLEEFNELRVSEADILLKTILTLTYPSLFDEDGNMIEIEDDGLELDKKTLNYIGAKLIRNGHIDVLKYRVNFVTTALEEIEDYGFDLIKNNSLAHRISKANDLEYGKIMKLNEPKQKVTNVDHEAQIKQMQGSK